MIELTSLEEMFANMRESPGWNVDGPLLWGYFFADPSPEKLEAAAEELAGLGYRQVGIWLAEDDDEETGAETGEDGEETGYVDEDGIDDIGDIAQPADEDEEEVYFLHVEKVEHHTPESLHRRNAEFDALAQRFELGSYDGMDVGPVTVE
jgi:hypothetical protein